MTDNMVQMKHRDRKSSAGSLVAPHPYVGQEYKRKIENLSNFRRHMAIVHKKNVDGSGTDDVTKVSRFSQYTKRSLRTRTQPTIDVHNLALFSSSSEVDSANDLFVDITDEHAVANAPNIKAINADDTLTDSTRIHVTVISGNTLASCQRVVRLQVATVVRPPAPTEPTAKRRWLEMAPSVLLC